MIKHGMGRRQGFPSLVPAREGGEGDVLIAAFVVEEGDVAADALEGALEVGEGLVAEEAGGLRGARVAVGEEEGGKLADAIDGAGVEELGGFDARALGEEEGVEAVEVVGEIGVACAGADQTVLRTAWMVRSSRPRAPRTETAAWRRAFASSPRPCRAAVPRGLSRRASCWALAAQNARARAGRSSISWGTAMKMSARAPRSRLAWATRARVALTARGPEVLGRVRPLSPRARSVGVSAARA